MTIELTEQQANNLKIFLSRTQLNGNEAVALLEILSKLEPKDKKETQQKTQVK